MYNLVKIVRFHLEMFLFSITDLINSKRIKREEVPHFLYDIKVKNQEIKRKESEKYRKAIVYIISFLISTLI